MKIEQRTPLPVVEATSKEVHAVEFLAGLDCQLFTSQKHLEPRLKLIPGAWQKYRTALAMIERVLTQVYDTLPVKTLKHIEMLGRHGEVIIRPKPAVRCDDVQIVGSSDLKVLINKAIAAECAFCIKRGGDVRGCQMRKTMMNIAPPVEMPKDGSCAYQNVAAGCKYGEYI